MPMYNDQTEAGSLSGGDIKSFATGNNNFQVKSNLYVLKSHYIAADKTSVLCKGDDCYFCKDVVSVTDANGKTKNKPRCPLKVDRYYFGTLNGVDCIMRVPYAVFEFMQTREVERKLNKRGRLFSVIKKGSGLDTDYIPNDEGAATEPTPEELNVNNAKLEGSVSRLEKYMADKYNEFVGWDEAISSAEKDDSKFEGLDIEDTGFPPKE